MESESESDSVSVCTGFGFDCNSSGIVYSTPRQIEGRLCGGNQRLFGGHKVLRGTIETRSISPEPPAAPMVRGVAG